MNTYDLVIANGLVADGSGGPLRRADVAVKGDRIRVVGPINLDHAARVVDASGRVVAPGFVDIHTHSDSTPFLDPFAASKVFDGVTTEVAGNCGFSPFPMLGEMRERRQGALAKAGWDIDWTDAAEYFQHYRSAPKLNNRAFLVGHGAVRASVVGYAARPAAPEELARMKDEVAKAMDQGAFGLSSGLIYPPGCYAPTSELIALARVVGEKGGYYATHIRGEGDSLESAIEEALAIGREAEVPVQIAHLKTSGRRNWRKIDWLEETLRRAIGEGQDVLCDRYPYVASSTGLSASLPDWAHDGGRQAALARLRDPAERRRIVGELNAEYDDEYWRSLLIAETHKKQNKPMQGQTVAALADQAGKPAPEFVIDLLLEENLTVQIVQFSMNEDNLKRIYRWPFVMVASDAGAKSLAGRLSGGAPHPRAFGTFCRALGKYSREEKVFSLPEAIRRMTALPADRIGLADRGRIAPGCYADIVVFDPDHVQDRATFEQPHQYSAGIEHVFVNGEAAIREGRLTGAMAGRLLTR